MIAIVDYGRGNLGSVEKAFERVGMDAVVTEDPGLVADAEAVVLPGDGAFHDAMASLDARGLTRAVRGSIEDGRPFLGICLGYQLLFSTSEEFGEGRGLDLIPGHVRRFPPGPKVPHMGWNRVHHGGRLRLFAGIPDGAHAAPRDDILGFVRLGEARAPTRRQAQIVTPGLPGGRDGP